MTSSWILKPLYDFQHALIVCCVGVDIEEALSVANAFGVEGFQDISDHFWILEGIALECWAVAEEVDILATILGDIVKELIPAWHHIGRRLIMRMICLAFYSFFSDPIIESWSCYSFNFATLVSRGDHSNCSHMRECTCVAADIELVLCVQTLLVSLHFRMV